MINIYFPFMSEDGVLGMGVILKPASYLFLNYKEPPL